MSYRPFAAVKFLVTLRLFIAGSVNSADFRTAVIHSGSADSREWLQVHKFPFLHSPRGP